MTKAQSKIDQIAFAQLVVRLSEYFHLCCQQPRPNEYHDLAQSNFEELSGVLENLGVIENIHDHNHCYKFTIPRNEVFDFVLSHIEMTDEKLSECLSAFLVNSFDYGLESSLTFAQTPFAVSQEDLALMHLCISYEYASQHGERFVWENKVTPIMVRWSYWIEAQNWEGEKSFIVNTSTQDEAKKRIRAAAGALDALPLLLKFRLRAVYHGKLKAMKTRPPFPIKLYERKIDETIGIIHPGGRTRRISDKQFGAYDIIGQHWNGKELTNFPNISAETNRKNRKSILKWMPVNESQLMLDLIESGW